MGKSEKKLTLTSDEWNYLWLYLDYSKSWRKKEMEEWEKLSYSENPTLRETADRNLSVLAKMNAAIADIHDRMTPRRSDE